MKELALNRERLELLGNRLTRSSCKKRGRTRLTALLMVDPTDPEVEEVLTRSGVAESPLGRVPKQNPDRTISSEGRPINDMRKQNTSGSKFNHPPAPQPRHTGVARQALWWRARHSRVPLRCAKRDVPRAFKWHYLRPRDVPQFAVKLLGIVVISLVMPFGWLGAPGQFVAWSSAAKAHHGSFSPPQPEFNDVVSYDSKWLMDDGVVLEPLVGNRVYHSLACLDRTMVAVWGKEGVNVEKMAEEGEPTGTQLFWGLYMDFDQQVISLPKPKRMKAKYLLAEPALQRGNRDVSLRLLQEVAGRPILVHRLPRDGPPPPCTVPAFHASAVVTGGRRKRATVKKLGIYARLCLRLTSRLPVISPGPSMLATLSYTVPRPTIAARLRPRPRAVAKMLVRSRLRCQCCFHRLGFCMRENAWLSRPCAIWDCHGLSMELASALSLSLPRTPAQVSRHTACDLPCQAPSIAPCEAWRRRPLLPRLQKCKQEPI